MPLYEYQCENCGKIEEAIQKFSDPPMTTCKHCSGKLTKLISQSSFHLKGTGWYVTDYTKSSKPSEKNKNSNSETPAKEKSDTGAAESKTLKNDE
jgi:putative FmdB family regulatory protein